MRGLVLLLLALLISIVLLPIGFMYQLVSTALKSLNGYLFKIAKSVDQLGNVVCVGLFDALFLKKQSVARFGNEDETVSSVLGRNKQEGTLTAIGRSLTWLLNTIEKDHVEKAIGH